MDRLEWEGDQLMENFGEVGVNDWRTSNVKRARTTHSLA